MHKEFTLLREEHLSEVGGIARLWQHNKTKAELISVINKDENKSFGVAFRTPPKNSTGVAHILEHSVLCGSKKYPVKEPFVELLKSSLQTFLNALTYPDKTCYPVASTNLQDFYNLIDVYLDAVFYPRIDENVLRQEGWHIHAEDMDTGKWSYKGVVYNEMKGVYSSPDSVLGEQSQHAVFPDTLYSLDSGGNPPEILHLTYEEFKDFHSRYYHPSNARFFFWGDDPEEARLEKLAELLKNFDAIKIDSAVPLQKRLPYERKIETFYAADEEDDNPRNAHVTVNWLLCEGKDAEEMMVLEMLEHILTALPGSPLRKALMDSGLGEDVAGCGLETELRQAYYSIGLRSVLPNDADKVELLILETLADLAERGMSQKVIDSAISATEFILRENNTGNFPRGLSAMFQSLSTWLYDEDPFLPLAWEKPLASIKQRLAGGEKVFENAIKKWFLDNTHRSLVVLLPNASLSEERAKEEQATLNKVINALNDKEKQEVVDLSNALAAAQASEDSAEALATIPTLSLKDIPLQGKENPLAVTQKKSITVLHHEIDTTGILYVRILLPLDHVAGEDLPLLSLYCRALTEMGTKHYDFVDLGLEISAQTGELDAGVAFHSKVDEDKPFMHLRIAAKVVEEKIDNLYKLLEEILLFPNFANKERFVQMVWEDKARFEQSIIPAGHSVLASCINGMFSRLGYLNEEANGLPYWNFIRRLAGTVQDDFANIEARLTTLHSSILTKAGAVLSLTGSADLIQKGEKLADLLESFTDKVPAFCERTYTFNRTPKGLLLPAQVNYVGLGTNLKEAGYVFHGSVHVITRFLRMGYLWDRVRVQGGAYGAFVRYARNTGTMAFVSYRDPNVEKTLAVYKQTAEFLGNLHLTQEELTKAVVGAMGDIDTYLLPSAKGNAALWEYMTGYTKEMRQQVRDEVLQTKLSDFHAFAPYLQKAMETSVDTALGGQQVQDYAAKAHWETIKLL